MRFGIRTKQVAGVTALVALAAAALYVWYLASIGHVLLDSSRKNARMLTNAVYQSAFDLVQRGGISAGADAAAQFAAAAREDEGLRTVLGFIAFSEGLEYAVIADPTGHIIAEADRTRIGQTLDPMGSLDHLIDAEGRVAELRAIFTPGGRSLEIRQPLIVGETELGTIRVGVSTLLVRGELVPRLIAPMLAALAVLAVSVLMAVLLARIALRPIHVIRTGLARLGRGELGVNVDLPADAELAELGDSFKQVSARLTADRTELAGQRALESVVDRLEDAVAFFAPDGTLLFSNDAMDASLAASAAPGGAGPAAPDAAPRKLAEVWPSGHPYRTAVERALSGVAPDTTAPVHVPDEGERLVLTHLVPGPGGTAVGVVLVSRNLAYLSQVESTLSYSRKLAALSRLTAGIAHEIKNPLNATMIHLELLRMQVADLPEALQNVAVIADQVRRLDDVVQGFMKFTRPEDLQLQPVALAAVIERLRPVLDAEAAKRGVDVRIDVPADLPPVAGDPNLLEQAFLNLGLNACQAMPDGGRLRIAARTAPGRLVAVEVEDTGVGIPPEHLAQIFDLYFTTKPQGSGIGLSLVFRTVQLHDGDIEVQSTPGRGTTFKILLRQAVT
jgi:signal transduction histidine kinase